MEGHLERSVRKVHSCYMAIKSEVSSFPQKFWFLDVQCNPTIHCSVFNTRCWGVGINLNPCKEVHFYGLATKVNI